MLKDPAELVIIESPYAGDPDAVEENNLYLDACIRDCIRRGESPYASHRMFPGALTDAYQYERELGLQAAANWLRHVPFAKLVVYTDRGVSPGMALAIEQAHKDKRPVEFRTLGSCFRSKMWEPL